MGVAVPPPKTDAPLVIDPNAPLADTIAGELLQAVARRGLQILERGGRVQDPQFAKASLEDVAAPFPDWFAVEQALGIAVAETGDHESK